MNRTTKQRWRFDRRVNVSTAVQLVLLASLIIGSWVNLQRQLALLQRDVGVLVENYRRLDTRLERLHEASLSHEYRLQTMEQTRAVIR